MRQAKILVFAGSARKNALSKKLAKVTAKIAADAGASVTFADLADYPAAIYNGDDEDADGMPESMKKFKALMVSNDGFIIVTPEYNGHVPPLLVNTFGWASRNEGGEKGMVAYKDKKAAIMASSPGKLGGIRVLPRLRDSLSELGVAVVPGVFPLPFAKEAFNDDGQLIDEKLVPRIRELVDKLVAACS